MHTQHTDPHSAGIATAKIGSGHAVDVTTITDGDLVRVVLNDHETWAHRTELSDVKSTANAPDVLAQLHRSQLDALETHADPKLIAKLYGVKQSELRGMIADERAKREALRQAEADAQAERERIQAEQDAANARAAAAEAAKRKDAEEADFQRRVREAVQQSLAPYVAPAATPMGSLADTAPKEAPPVVVTVRPRRAGDAPPAPAVGSFDEITSQITTHPAPAAPEAPAPAEVTIVRPRR